MPLYAVQVHLIVHYTFTEFHHMCSNQKAITDRSFVFYCLTAMLFVCRDEIASCSERAYKQLSVSEAQKLMLFTSSKEAAEFAEQVCNLPA